MTVRVPTSSRGMTSTQRGIASVASGSVMFTNVKAPQFGAQGDGTTIDTAGIQAAINSMSSGGILFFPRGVYLVDRSLQVTQRSNIRFLGTGIDTTTIRCTAALDGTDPTTQNNLFNANNSVHVTCTTASGNNQLTNVSPTAPPGVVNGAIVFAAGVPSGATIVSGLGTATWTLSTTATSSASSVSAAVAQGVPGSYQTGLIWEDLTLDCTLQSAAGIPANTTAGYNLCAIECQNVDRAQARRVRFIKAFGNAFVAASIDPRTTAAVLGATVEDCVFDDCVQGILPQYGIAGSVTQFGAMLGGQILRNQFNNSGGPAIDVFNCSAGTDIGHNHFTGGRAGPIGSGQGMNGIHSDFGLVDCNIHDNTMLNAGAIALAGNMDPVAFNIVPTLGPQRCAITGNHIQDTWKFPATGPVLPASGVTVQPAAGAPLALTIIGAASFSLKLNGVSQNPSGPDGNQYAVPGYTVNATLTAGSPTITNVVSPPGGVIADTNSIAGYGIPPGTTIVSGTGTATWVLSQPATISRTLATLSATANVQLTYTGTPSWTWQAAPSLFSGQIVLAGGGIPSGTLARTADNQLTENTLIQAPVDAIYLSDGYANSVQGNTILDPGEWSPSAPFFCHDTTFASGSGCRENTFAGNHIEDGRAIKTMFAIYRDDSANCVNNRLVHNRLEITTTGLPPGSGGSGTPMFSLASPEQNLIRGNYGPGNPSGALTAPVVPASTVVLVNPFPWDVDVYVSGGTVTNIVRNNTSTGLTAGMVRLRAGGSTSSQTVLGGGGPVTIDNRDWISITYSVAPTWQWFVAA